MTGMSAFVSVEPCLTEIPLVFLVTVRLGRVAVKDQRLDVKDQRLDVIDSGGDGAGNQDHDQGHPGGPGGRRA